MAGDSQQELAQERTEWARERTLLARERTFAAWIRTGLATAAVGFGVAELLGDVQPQWLTTLIGGTLLATGAAIFAIALWSYRSGSRRLRAAGIRGVPLWLITLLCLVLALCAVAGLVLILWN